jgi:hypothetical protein
MLASCKMVGFVPARDSQKAREFYEGKVPKDFAPVAFTILGWEVQDIEAVVAWLKGRGVAFEKYPFIQDPELGIWTAPGGDKVAWFKDPDGNVLSVAQHV